MNYSTQTLIDVKKGIDDNWNRTHAWSKDVEDAFNRPFIKTEYSYEWLKVTCNMLANVVGDKKLTAEEWWELLKAELK